MASINLLGLRKDFQIHQGNTISADLELFDVSGQPLDMSGYTVVSEIRYAATGRVAITCTLANSYLSWTNQNEGKFRLNIPASATSSLLFDKTEPDSLGLVYDIEINSNTPEPGVQKPFYGSITLMREQTRII